MSGATPPGDLQDQQRRPKALRLAEGVDWYVVDRGRFELVGSGDVSADDLQAVGGDLGGSAVFVCVARPTPLEAYLPRSRAFGTWGVKRITRSATAKVRPRPKLRWVANGARLAVLPGRGTVWVDDEHLFKPGESVPLPWTRPPVELVVVRPATVYKAMRSAVGPSGPRRADVPIPGSD